MNHGVLKIMLVDDDKEDREFLHFLFSKNAKFEIVGCFDSAEKIIEEITVHKNIPDLLMMDLYMPLMNGDEVLHELVLKHAAPGMFTFIISTTINENAEEKFTANKNVRFLKKPATLKEINDLPGIILESLDHRNNTKV